MKNQVKQSIIYQILSILIINFCCTQVNQNKIIDSEGNIISFFTETDTVTSNPSKGWMVFQNLPQKTPRFPGTVAYNRFNWDELEPSEGQFNWAIIDTALTAWEKCGRRFAFRIMTTNPHSKGYYCSPKWLFDKGCHGYEYVYSSDITQANPEKITRIEVDYGDSIFLFNHNNFIKALAAQYDGNKNIEFIDIGSYGRWGEWHTYNPVPIDIREKIFDFYTQNFLKTQLMAMSLNDTIFNYAMKKGTGFRRDGIGYISDYTLWYSDKNVENINYKSNAWKNVPIVFEWYANYDILSSNSACSFETGLQFIYNNHATYILDNLGEITDTSVLKKLAQLGQKCGYELMLREIAHKPSMSKNDTFSIKMVWENIGIAAIQRNPNLTLYFTKEYPDTDYSIKQETSLEIGLPGELVMKDMKIPTDIESGKFTIGISLQDPLTEMNISMPINAPNKNGVYTVSEIEIKQ